MKIAVVTDDHQTISTHFGRALYYEVFTIIDSKITQKETLMKPSHNQFANEPHDEPGHTHGMGPVAEGRHMRMLEPISGCQVLITRGMGQGAFNSLQRAGVQPIITDIEEIEAAVKAYIDGQMVDHPERLH
jgi:predicted Fe-Mo cluster-binding NifX family protein